MPCVEHLPQQQGMHHPRLARAGGHLDGILGHLVLLLRQRVHVHLSHHVGYNGSVVVLHGLHTGHLVQVDGVQYGLALSCVEVVGALDGEWFAEPVLQQFARDGRHPFHHLAALPGLVHLVAQPLRQQQRYIVLVVLCHIVVFILPPLRGYPMVGGMYRGLAPTANRCRPLRGLNP